MAREIGLSKSSAQRLWSAHAIAAHRLELQTFRRFALKRSSGMWLASISIRLIALCFCVAMRRVSVSPLAQSALSAPEPRSYPHPYPYYRHGTSPCLPPSTISLHLCSYPFSSPSFFLPPIYSSPPLYSFISPTHSHIPHLLLSSLFLFPPPSSPALPFYFFAISFARAVSHSPSTFSLPYHHTLPPLPPNPLSRLSIYL